MQLRTVRTVRLNLVCAAYEAFCDPPPVRPLRSEIRERDRVLVQVVLDVPALEPGLPDGPFGRPDGGRAEDVRDARLPVHSAVEHVCPSVDVVHRAARGEAEPEARGGTRAVVRALLRREVGIREVSDCAAHEEGRRVTYQSYGDAAVGLFGDVVSYGLEYGSDLV